MLGGQSRYRHVYGSAGSRDQCYEGVRASTGSAHDTSLCAVNRRYIAMIVESSGGGVFVVLPLHAVRSHFTALSHRLVSSITPCNSFTDMHGRSQGAGSWG